MTNNTADTVLTLAERRELHPREFEVHDHTRQARALVHFLHGDEHDADGFTSAAALHSDALAGVASLLEDAHDALGLTAVHARPAAVPATLEDMAETPMPDVLDGLPEDFTGSTLARTLGLVRLLGAADEVPNADRSAVLWTVFGLLDALVTVLDRVTLFAPAPAGTDARP